MRPNIVTIKAFKSPMGELLLGEYDDKLCLCDWRYRKMRDTVDQRICKGLHAIYKEGEAQVLDDTISQLKEYFKRNRTNFNVPLLLVGSDFQKQVWHALQQIPYGQSSTYLALSRQLKNEKAIRAVASANGANAISIIVPCHRIIGSDGSLVGYAGGLDAKKKLLKIESILIKGQMELF